MKWDGTYVVRVAEELPSYGIAIPLDDLVVIIGLGPGEYLYNHAGKDPMTDLVAENVLRPGRHVPNYPGALASIFCCLKLFHSELQNPPRVMSTKPP